MSTKVLKNREAFAKLNDWSEATVPQAVAREAVDSYQLPQSKWSVSLYRYTMPSGAVYLEFVQTLCCEGSQKVYLALKDETGNTVDSSMWWQ